MIHVIAVFELRPGQRQSFLTAFEEIVSTVRAEEGCIEYGAAVDLATELPVQAPVRPDVVTVLEKWQSVDHLTRHLAQPHLQAFLPQAQALSVNITVSILEPV